MEKLFQYLIYIDVFSVYKGDETDTTVYEWNMSELLVKATQKSSDNEILLYVEYKIDNNKKVIRSTYFDCNESGCEESGYYATIDYGTTIKKPVSNRMIAAQKSGKLKMYSINGRSISANLNMANSVFIRNRNGKATTQMKLK